MSPEDFVRKIRALYAAPRHLAGSEASEALQEYADALRPYSGPVLAAAYARLRDTRQYPTWPPVGDCVAAARECARTAGGETRGSAPREIPYAEWTAARMAEADALCRSPLGRQAAREGWLLSAHDYCRQHRRLPPEHVLPQLKAAAAFVTAYASGGADDDGPAAAALRRLAAAILQRREEVRARVTAKDAGACT